MVSAQIRFQERRGDVLSLLEIERPLSPRGIEALLSLLVSLRVQIVSARVRIKGERVEETFTLCDLDGAPLSRARRKEIERAVLGNLAGAQRDEVEVIPAPSRAPRGYAHRLGL